MHADSYSLSCCCLTCWKRDGGERERGREGESIGGPRSHARTQAKEGLRVKRGARQAESHLKGHVAVATSPAAAATVLSATSAIDLLMHFAFARTFAHAIQRRAAKERERKENQKSKGEGDGGNC